MKRYNLTIHGKVQGVFYRASAKEKAEELGLKGIVENKPDGTVYAEAEGDEEALEQFVQWCEDGPPAAKPTKVEKEEAPLKHYSQFTIEG